MGLSELKNDAKLLAEQLATMSGDQFDAKRQLTDNILPLMIGICEAVQDDVEVPLEALEEAVDQLIDQDGDVLHPETAEQLLKLVALGRLLAKELTAALPKLDDVAKKRARAMIIGYREHSETVSQIITEITLADEPDQGGEEPAPEEAGEQAGDENADADEDDGSDAVEGG